MSDNPTTPSRDAVYDRQRLTDCLLELSKHTRLQGQQFEKIRSATNEMERQIQEFEREMHESLREMRAGFARIDSRLDKIDSRIHNIEAREKNQNAYLNRVDYVPLLKADGTAIANFPRNAQAVEDLDDETIDALLTDLGVDFQGRELYKKRPLFLRAIGVEVTYI